MYHLSEHWKGIIIFFYHESHKARAILEIDTFDSEGNILVFIIFNNIEKFFFIILNNFENSALLASPTSLAPWPP